MALVNVSPKTRMETVDGDVFPASLIDGHESWNVYEYVNVVNRLNPVTGTLTNELQVWVKRGELMTQADALALCQQITNAV